jgi:hypothetical protein
VPADHVDILLLEYEQLKREQNSRIRVRDNLVYASLVAAAAVISAVLSSHDLRALLLLPPVALILGWTYLINDQKISAAGHYIRCALSPELAVLVDRDSVFGWEEAHRGDRRRLSRKLMQLFVDLLAFCALPFTSLMVYAANFPDMGLFMVVAIVECVVLLTLAAQFLIYAEL